MSTNYQRSKDLNELARKFDEFAGTRERDEFELKFREHLYEPLKDRIKNLDIKMTLSEKLRLNGGFKRDEMVVFMSNPSYQDDQPKTNFVTDFMLKKERTEHGKLYLNAEYGLLSVSPQNTGTYSNTIPVKLSGANAVFDSNSIKYQTIGGQKKKEPVKNPTCHWVNKEEVRKQRKAKATIAKASRNKNRK